MSKWIFLCLYALVSSNLLFANESMIVRFELTDEVKQFLRSQEFDITGINLREKHIDAFLTEDQLDLVKNKKFNIEFSFPKSLIAAPDKEYKNPQEVEEFLFDIHARYPEYTKLKEIGKTLEGRPIWAIKITGSEENVQKSVFFINGMHHAREVMTPEITTDMVEYLVTRYRSDDKVTKWMDETVIWVLPMFNLDGNNMMWNGNPMWRKNTRDGHGVDINRNYPTAWNTCRGSSGSTWAQDYRGVSPASEPETQAMMNFIGSIKPVFSISYHSYSEIVIYPFGCGPKLPPEIEPVVSIGKELGQILDYEPGTSWELLYNVDGGDIDYLYTEHQVIPYVVEVNSSREGFQPSYTQWRNKTVERNRPGWMYLLNRLQGPSIQGRVDLNEYKKIELWTIGASRPFKTYNINPDGTFHIILKQSWYDVNFIGNKTKSFANIKVDKKIVLNP
jgi:carboxypeptidase T